MHVPFFHRLAFAMSLMITLLTAAAARAQVEAIATPRHDLRLGFTVAGRVVQTLVQPGDRVEQGQPLVRLDDQESQAQIDLYVLRGESDLDELAAEAEWRLAQNEEARVRDAFSKEAAGAFEVERAALQTQRKQTELAIARQRRAEAQAMLRQARARHGEYTLLAPMSGVIEQTLVSPGEMVEASRPVLRLVVTDPLRVEAPVLTRQTMSLRVGAPAWVTLSLPGQTEAVRGKIVHIAQVADAASDTRVVRIEIPNPTGLPAGCHAMVAFGPPAAPSSGSATSSLSKP